MLLAYIYRSITHRVHFLDKASRDLFICAKDLFVEANGPHGAISLQSVLSFIASRSFFLIGELLLGKLSKTVVVQGNSPHDRPGVSSDRQLCELPLHESANAQGPTRTFWMSFQDLLGGEAFANSRHQINARLAGHGADGFRISKLMGKAPTGQSAN